MVRLQQRGGCKLPPLLCCHSTRRQVRGFLADLCLLFRDRLVLFGSFRVGQRWSGSELFSRDSPSNFCNLGSRRSPCDCRRRSCGQRRSACLRHLQLGILQCLTLDLLLHLPHSLLNGPRKIG